MNGLLTLQKWFASVCDGDREHRFGIVIETVDNPGWSVTVDLFDTSLMGKPFAPFDVKRSEDDWVALRVVEGRFVGSGGVGNLNEILEVFGCWMMANGGMSQADHQASLCE